MCFFVEGDSVDTIDRIFGLMASKGVTPTQLSREVGLTTGLTTQWKQRKQKPSADAIIKIANYFGVSIDYLLTGEEYIAPALEPHERLLLDLLRDLPPEKREQALRLIKAL